MRKLILKWLFGVDDIDKYVDLIADNVELRDNNIYILSERINELKAHRKTIEEQLDILNDMIKLIKICENHGIDVDKEIKGVEL